MALVLFRVSASTQYGQEAFLTTVHRSFLFLSSNQGPKISIYGCIITVITFSLQIQFMIKCLMVFIPLPVIFLLISGLRYWFSRIDTLSKGQTIIEEPSLRSAMHMLFELPSSPQILKSKTIRVVLAFEHLDNILLVKR